ncbi:hypothetical protein [Massilia cavernae]|uniref:hypothetical protein n=1 Tax=Massilia cavernae TaxID=2320864 RepID=UPI0011C356A0|nr:hypothetical protein [Massilia cavernae]
MIWKFASSSIDKSAMSGRFRTSAAAGKTIISEATGASQALYFRVNAWCGRSILYLFRAGHVFPIINQKRHRSDAFYNYCNYFGMAVFVVVV